MIGLSCACLNVHVSMSPDASAAILHVLRVSKVRSVVGRVS